MSVDQRKKNRVKQLKVDEVSLVDNPANAGARFVLMKRAPVEDVIKDGEEDEVEIIDGDEGDDSGEGDDIELMSDDEIDAELDALEAELDDIVASGNEGDESDESDESDEYEDGYEDDAVEDEQEVEVVGKVAGHKKGCKCADCAEANKDVNKAYTLFSSARARTSVWPMIDALRESVTSIVNDDESTEVQKKEAIAKTSQQFATEMAKLVVDAGTDGPVEKSNNSGDRIMKTARQPISKQQEERIAKLHDENVSLTKRIEKMEEDKANEAATRQARSILGKSAPKEDVEAAVELIKSNNEKGIELLKRIAKRNQTLQKSSGLFEEIGSSAAGRSGGSSGARAAEELAQELRKNDPKLTRSEAISKAYETLGDEAYLDAESDDVEFID